MAFVATVTTNPVEAHIIKGRLEAEGVSAAIVFQYHIWANWTLSVALGGVRVVVPLEQVDSARGIISAIDSGEYESMLSGELQPSGLECPRCGSLETAPHAWLWKLALILVVYASLVFPYTSHLYSCDNCKHSWIAHTQRPHPLFAIALSVVTTAGVIFAVFMGISMLSSFLGLSPSVSFAVWGS